MQPISTAKKVVSSTEMFYDLPFFSAFPHVILQDAYLPTQPLACAKVWAVLGIATGSSHRLGESKIFLAYSLDFLRIEYIS